MSKTGEKFQTKLGFILSCVGSAVGMANIWAFPYRVGKYGGAVFLIIYFMFIALFSAVGLSAEFVIGRRSGTGTLGSYEYAWNDVKKGKLELLATCATDLFVPHYADTKEIISAQIECGLNAYRQYFGETPEGFWIPELGYYPGLENLIKAYGFSYTVLDARSVLLAEKMPSKGIFYPVRTENSLAIFASDPQIEEMIFGEEGYCSDEVYCNSNRDIGFDLTMKQL